MEKIIKLIKDNAMIIGALIAAYFFFVKKK